MTVARVSFLWWMPPLALLVMMLGCQGASTDQVDASFIHIPGADEPSGGPQMSWDKTHIDLGLVAAGETRTLAYTLTNTGKAPMVIAQIIPSCGCTVADDIDPSPLAPGDMRTIALNFTAGESTQDIGESASVVSNAIPATAELTFEARVLGPDAIPTTTP